MKKLIGTVPLVMVATALVAAQGSKPDFSGTWMLDLKKSSSTGLPTRPDVPIRISHQDPELRVIRTSESNGQTVEREFVYYTDGRGETNQATSLLTTNPGGAKASDLQNKQTKSRTKWSGDKLVTRARIRMTVAGHMLEYEIIDEWKLSADRKVLTQTSRLVFQQSDAAFIPAIVPDTKKVYNRT
ncbi:MAG TPA: hypothetical protein VJT71_02320 [Pyrinomonadaceae bacterium]|nr:hypothetical protein [Pyrinomonadaceae bacterium]